MHSSPWVVRVDESKGKKCHGTLGLKTLHTLPRTFFHTVDVDLATFDSSCSLFLSLLYRTGNKHVMAVNRKKNFLAL